MYDTRLDVFKKWAPIIPSKNRNELNNWFRDKDAFLKLNIAKIYAQKLKPYMDELSSSNESQFNMISAGVFCFCGQLLMYLSQRYSAGSTSSLSDNELIDTSFDFCLLYMYVDYFLDSTSISEVDKENKLEYMYRTLINPCTDCNIPGMKGLQSSYKRILERTPGAKPALISLFLGEVNTIPIQKNKNNNRDMYMFAAIIKGGLTGIAIQTIQGIELKDDCCKIGSILQLLDDMMDVEQDILDGINTVATYDYIKEGCVDTVFMNTLNIVESIDDSFFMFKIVIVQILGYISSIKGRCSSYIKRMAKSRSLIRYKDESNVMDMCSKAILELMH